MKKKIVVPILDIKMDVTKYAMQQLNLEVNEKTVKKTVPVWWKNFRKKTSGGLRLTQQGYACLKNADLKDYRVAFETPIEFTGQLVIRLDRYIDCPFYLTNEEIFVFSEKMAVQLVLFSGDLLRFSSAKAESLKAT